MVSKSLECCASYKGENLDNNLFTLGVYDIDEVSV